MRGKREYERVEIERIRFTRRVTVKRATIGRIDEAAQHEHRLPGEGDAVAAADAEGLDADGLPPGEGCFLPLSFLYVGNLARQGRKTAVVTIDPAKRLADALGLEG